MEKYTTNLNFDIEIPASRERKNRGNLRVVTENEVQDVVKKKKKKKVNKAGILFHILSVFLGAAIVAIVGFIFIVTMCSLENIEYEGVTNANPKEIEAALFNDKYCNNAIYAWAKNNIRSHDAIPFVKDLSVYLKNKNTVVVSVKEDDLFGVIDMQGTYVYFDQRGNVSEVSKKYISSVPIVTGLIPSDAKENESLAVSKTQKNALVKVLKYLREAKVTPDSVIFEEDGTFGFMTKDIFVDLGMSSEIREKCERLPYILPTIMDQKGTLHLEEWSPENTDIVFEKSE